MEKNLISYPVPVLSCTQFFDSSFLQPKNSKCTELHNLYGLKPAPCTSTHHKKVSYKEKRPEVTGLLITDRGLTVNSIIRKQGKD